MILELNESQARLVKEALLELVNDEDIWLERLEEYEALLGEDKAKQLVEKMFSGIGEILEKFKNVESIDESHGYDIGLAQIFDNDIYIQLLPDEDCLER